MALFLVGAMVTMVSGAILAIEFLVVAVGLLEWLAATVGPVRLAAVVFVIGVTTMVTSFELACRHGYA